MVNRNCMLYGLCSGLNQLKCDTCKHKEKIADLKHQMEQQSEQDVAGTQAMINISEAAGLEGGLD